MWQKFKIIRVFLEVADLVAYANIIYPKLLRMLVHTHKAKGMLTMGCFLFLLDYAFNIKTPFFL